MSETAKNLSRRDFLTQVPFEATAKWAPPLAAGGILIAHGFNYLRSQVDQVPLEKQIPPIETWPVKEIPLNGDYSILHNPTTIYPNIGVARIYLAGDPNYPMAFIGCVFKEDQVKVEYHEFPKFRSRLSLPGAFGLQLISDKGPFIYSQHATLRGIDLSTISPNALAPFEQNKIDGIRDEIWQKPNISQSRTRPEPGRDFALVFDQGLVEFQGAPSPKAVLAVRLRFTQPSLV